MKTIYKQQHGAKTKGVGMTHFIKPRGKVDYPELALHSASKALIDAQLTYDDIEQTVSGYVYGDSNCGQRALYQLGLWRYNFYWTRFTDLFQA